MVLRLNFDGFGAIVGPGFASDVSDSCFWITPFILEPEEVNFK